MRLVCISDTHNAHKASQIPEGDVLIHAGDATGQGLSTEVERFLDWFAAQPHPHKILIAGNHDWLFQRHPDMATQMLAGRPGITYLQDSGTEIDGVKFWGSPWQPWFCDWAFNLPRKGEDLQRIWGQIPEDTQVLITHGPPHGVLDQVRGGTHLGCEELKIRVATVQPQVHIFGHIHDSFGIAQSRTTTYVNACSCDEDYQLHHCPIVLDLGPSSTTVYGIEPNLRLECLNRLQLALAQPVEETQQPVPYKMLQVYIQGLEDMAEIRGLQVEELLRHYVSRGLQADLGKQLRAEDRPNKRPIPFTNLEKRSGEE